MTIPTRWHKPSCETPHVVVDGSVPTCRACGNSASALLETAAKGPAPSYSGIRLPPEAPIGLMDLWWPPSVPYTRNGEPRAQAVAPSSDAVCLAPQASDSSLSEIYTSTLGRDHFRLLYLSESLELDSPIHGKLVEYRQDDCPEYETVSYTWGGEDGDATPCKPAYFGDFWDVLFLTRNCWALLQYLRPRTVTRIVWVDAICINQNNMQERGTQVSLMPQIYGNCMRVVIYPGDHVVRSREHRFRDRVKIRNASEASRIEMLDSVLESRYMRRVWIVQELILAPGAILAIEHHDICLANEVLHDIANDYNHAHPGYIQGRDWLKYIGQPWNIDEPNLCSGMKMTLASQATDPRDRIFGILGILGKHPTYSQLVPEYSLSMRDCVIGAMGFALLVSKEFWPLLSVREPERSPYLQGVDANTKQRYPSWVPSLNDIASWTDQPVTGWPSFDGNRTVPGKWVTEISVGRYTPNHDLFVPWKSQDNGDEFDSWSRNSQHLLVEFGMSWDQGASIDSQSGALTLRLVRLFDIAHEVLVEPVEVKPVQTRDGLYMPCQSKDNVMRECQFSHIFVKGPSASAHFHSTKQVADLGSRPCHLFLAFQNRPDSKLDKEFSDYRQSNSHLLLAHESETSGAFDLVDCCRLEMAKFFSASPLPPPPTPLLSSFPCGALGRGNLHSVFSLYEVLLRIRDYNPQEQWLENHEADPQLNYGTNSKGSEAMLFDFILPGQGSNAPIFLQLALAATRAGESSTVTEEFKRAYATCLRSLPAEFNPVLGDEYVQFTLADDAALEHFVKYLLRYLPDSRQRRSWEKEWLPWHKMFPAWFDLQIPEIGNSLFEGHRCRKANSESEGNSSGEAGGKGSHCCRHQGYEQDDQAGLHYYLPCGEEPAEVQMPVRAEMPLRNIVKVMRDTRLHWLNIYLIGFAEKMSESVEALFERGPRPEDSNNFLHEWPKSLVDELGFAWREEMVTFA